MFCFVFCKQLFSTFFCLGSWKNFLSRKNWKKFSLALGAADSPFCRCPPDMLCTPLKVTPTSCLQLELMVQTYHWPLSVFSYHLALALSPQWPDMDQSRPELGFTSRKEKCTHRSLSSTNCGHGHRYPSSTPLSGCDHGGMNLSQREAVADEVRK